MTYYIRQNEEARGPYTIGQLRSMWNAGNLTGDTLYRKEGSDVWKVLSSQLESPPPVDQQAPVLPPQRFWSPGAALVLSFFIPGLGQMYRGKIGWGIVWLLLVPFLWLVAFAVAQSSDGSGSAKLVFAALPLIFHLLCLVDAYSGDPTIQKR